MKSNRETGKRGKSMKEELDESFVSPKLSEKERDEAEAAFREHRRKVESKRTVEDILKTELLQLKFSMEDYLKSERYNETFSFGYFLKLYIEKLNKKNNEFADEININPTELSQLINKHRDPNPRIIIRLEVHSNRIFPAILWYNLFAKEKALEFIKNDSLRKDEERQVKKKLEFSI